MWIFKKSLYVYQQTLKNPLNDVLIVPSFIFFHLNTRASAELDLTITYKYVRAHSGY